MARAKTHFSLVCALAAFAASRTASAQAPLPEEPAVAPAPSPPPPARDEREEQREKEAEERRTRIGAIAGVGFPRPIAVEGLVKLEDRIALGVEYATMPTITISDVDVHLWSLAADARLFPLGGVLFVGLRAGRQHIAADTSIAPISAQRVGIAVDSWYVNPRVGILWMSKFGLTLGTEAGVQIPFAADVKNNVPPDVANADQVRTASNAFGKQVIPTVDLLRVGLTL